MNHGDSKNVADKDTKLGEREHLPLSSTPRKWCYRDENGLLSFSGLSLYAWAGVALTFILGYAVLGGIGAVVLVGALEGGSTALYAYLALFGAYIGAGAVALLVIEVRQKKPADGVVPAAGVARNDDSVVERKGV
mmetsp:Transcript_34603/g.64100  ORF Transcript_34603/g.64100 Transcript_34603/m.64100 type:complete len:135 (-) Transcript_34603:326-730(-)|eukprot:CAMPEP_0170184682 /NCGR_PEP_ID=MMETSP0040_2-20121228/34340_1 /TAXON_ID=641309 /ORGANISM="Lotharella oceanica, Strain CCMP622" /LENGTH=134 /DNA_ID=CAMNT_0010430821 /DNA_START=28 /DNA_END=432 /DNA_ORIENTATION=+